MHIARSRLAALAIGAAVAASLVVAGPAAAHEGHDHGPNSAEARAALARIDAAIGRLLDGLAARDLAEQVNLVLVSDHGMAEVAPSQRIAVEDLIEPELAVVTSVGQSIGIASRPGVQTRRDPRPDRQRRRLPAAGAADRHLPGAERRQYRAVAAGLARSLSGGDAV